jgi:polyphosphate kinase
MFFNRDLSWLEFNARVLHEAADRRNPLLERVKFLQIFTSNLDEFFMKRVGGLKRQIALGLGATKNQPIEPTELLLKIRNRLQPRLKQQATCWSEDIFPALQKEGILLLGWSDLNRREKTAMHNYFDKNLFPVLTPLSVGPGHPFPFISNLSNSLGVLLKDPQPFSTSSESPEAEVLFARVKIPNFFPELISLGHDRFISITNVVTQFIAKLFPGTEISASLAFRITRNAEIERDEEDVEDLLEMITEELRERRFADVVRLEHGPKANPQLREFFKTELELNEDDIYENYTPVNFSTLNAIAEIKRRNLKFRPWTPVIPHVLQDSEKSIFEIIKEGDFLVHHPYESFHQSVERFISSAVNDPQVMAIKMTLYRPGPESPFIPLLIRAAESGKQVVCLVELKARFDEECNIRAARLLEKAGVHIVYGIVGLKTHCKVALVVRKEESQVQSYVHIGTGNYNAATSRVYTDMGLFTAKPEFTDDIIQLFHFLTGRSHDHIYQKLIISPIQMKPKFLELIEIETDQALQKRPARIVAKVNSLEDRDVIQALYRASQAGVQIDLVVRGFCCLVPQVKNLSENIRVISVIGRFLEHCRIFYFQNRAENPLNGKVMMGSADWMTRNLSARVEVVVPVEETTLKKKIMDYLVVLLNDQRQAWDLDSRGNYIQRVPQSSINESGTHETEMKLYNNAAPWPLNVLSIGHTL